MAISDATIMTALIAAGSVRAAAKAAGIAESTIRNRLKDETFRAEYDRQRCDVLQEATQALTARLSLAADTLADVLEDDSAPATVKISASDSLLRHGLRYVEAADFERRLAALEAAAQEAET